MAKIKNVLITGGSGYVGTCLSQMLYKKKINVLTTSREKNRSIEFDSEKSAFPKSILNGIDTVFHLIGHTHDTSKNKSPTNKYLDINLKLTIEIVNLANLSGVKNFIFLSSTKAIGIENQNSEISEYDQSIPKDIYGKSKRDAEIYLLNFKKKSNMNISIIRSPLIYGNKVKGNLFNLINWVKKKRFPQIKTSNKRSMIHVSDLCEAMILISEKDNLKQNIFLVTDNYKYSTTEIIELIRSSLNYKKEKFTFPIFFLLILAYFGDLVNFFFKFPFDKKKYNKLVNNEYYSSNEIKKLGFTPKHNFYSAINDMLKYIK